jgi:hypothetical protein
LEAKEPGWAAVGLAMVLTAGTFWYGRVKIEAQRNNSAFWKKTFNRGPRFGGWSTLDNPHSVSGGGDAENVSGGAMMICSGVQSGAGEY